MLHHEKPEIYNPLLVVYDVYVKTASYKIRIRIRIRILYWPIKDPQGA